jgi:hypothetical protein
MKIKVALGDSGSFFNIKTGVNYSRKQLQNLTDYGVDVVYIYDYLERL